MLGNLTVKVDGDRGRGVFEGTSLTKINLPANISFIGSSTFSELTNLTEVNIPAEAQITSIGDNAFYKTGITAINLGQSVTEIGKYAFALTKLSTITIPATVQNLRAYALSTDTLTDHLRRGRSRRLQPDHLRLCHGRHLHHGNHPAQPSDQDR